MSGTIPNQIRIDNYIREHPTCELPGTIPLILQGERHDLSTYRLPLELLYFNIHNGRFAAEYKELVEKEGEDLDSTKEKDAKKIRNLLLKLDPGATEVTKQDIIKRGQWREGVITHDGFVIDGNRRMAILSDLSEDGTDKFKFMNVARLPPSVSPTDLWKVEAGIQLGKDEILSYGPINELLKFKDGVASGLSVEEISKTLYGYDNMVEEINEKLERLKLIEDYLRFVGKPLKYREAAGKVEHFIDLQKILKTAKADGTPILELDQIKRIGFSLIAKTRITHLRLRQMKKMIRNADAKTELLKASQYAKPIPPVKSDAVSTEATSKGFEDLVKTTVDPDPFDEDEDEEAEHDVVSTIYTNAEDIVKASEKKDVEKLLNAAKINLSYAVRTESQDLQKDSAKEIIKQIIRYTEKLKTYLDS